MIKTRVRVRVSRFSVGAVFRQTPSNSVVLCFILHIIRHNFLKIVLLESEVFETALCAAGRWLITIV